KDLLPHGTCGERGVKRRSKSEGRVILSDPAYAGESKDLLSKERSNKALLTRFDRTLLIFHLTKSLLSLQSPSFIA
ncbi:hypothetical protein K9L63_01875, partial [Candidatus Gracilibacteria bacterium]|nr:hypothetical protein [Candidatus Gracilibacteria bacterium]